MKKPSRVKSAIGAALVLLTTVGPVTRSWAGDAWENGKAYTAMLADAAKAAAAAVGAAAGALGAAKADLAAAQAAAAAANAAAETSAATIGAMEASGAAVAAAEATLAAATTAAAAAAAIVAGATLGTLAGQGLRGLWSLCFDPVCDLTAMSIGGGPIYFPATDAEVDGLIPELVTTTTGLNLTISDFEAAGDGGLKSLAFIKGGIHMFLGASRAAAAATAGRNDEVLDVAIPELQNELTQFPGTITDFAQVLRNTSLQSPVEGLNQAHSEFESAVSNAIEVAGKELSPEAYNEFISQLEIVENQFAAAQKEVGSVNYPPLVGENGAFQNLTVDRFQRFIDDCKTKGADALPPEEVSMADQLLHAAGTYFPEASSFGPGIAQYDAGGDNGLNDNSHEVALFGDSGTLDIATLLDKSVSELSKVGAWLDISLDDSGLAKEIRGKSSSEAPSAGGCSLVRE